MKLHCRRSQPPTGWASIFEFFRPEKNSKLLITRPRGTSLFRRNAALNSTGPNWLSALFRRLIDFQLEKKRPKLGKRYRAAILHRTSSSSLQSDVSRPLMSRRCRPPAISTDSNTGSCIVNYQEHPAIETGRSTPATAGTSTRQIRSWQTSRRKPLTLTGSRSFALDQSSQPTA